MSNFAMKSTFLFFWKFCTWKFKKKFW